MRTGANQGHVYDILRGDEPRPWVYGFDFLSPVAELLKFRTTTNDALMRNAPIASRSLHVVESMLKENAMTGGWYSDLLQRYCQPVVEMTQRKFSLLERKLGDSAKNAELVAQTLSRKKSPSSQNVSKSVAVNRDRNRTAEDTAASSSISSVKGWISHCQETNLVS